MLVATAAVIGWILEWTWLVRIAFVGMSVASVCVIAGVALVAWHMPPPRPLREVSALAAPTSWFLRFVSGAALLGGTLVLGAMSGSDLATSRAAGNDDTAFLWEVVGLLALVAVLYGAFVAAVWLLLAMWRTGPRNRRRGVIRAAARMPSKDRDQWRRLFEVFGDPGWVVGMLGLALCWLVTLTITQYGGVAS